MISKNIFRIIYISASSLLALIGSQLSTLLKLPAIILILIFTCLVIVLIITELKYFPQNYPPNIANNAKSKHLKFYKKNKLMLIINNMPLLFAIVLGVILGSLLFYLLIHSDFGVLNYQSIDGRKVLRRTFLIFIFPVFNYELVSFLVSTCFCLLYYYLFGSGNLLLFSIGIGVGTGVSFILLDPANDFLSTIIYTPLILLALSLLVLTSKKSWWFVVVGFILIALPFGIEITRHYLNSPNSENQYEYEWIDLYSDGSHSVVYKKPFNRIPQLRVKVANDDTTKIYVKILSQDKTHFKIEVKSPKYPIIIEYEAVTGESGIDIF